MIKVEYRIKFPDEVNMAELAVHPKLIELREFFQTIRDEAAKRNCAQFRDAKSEKEFTMFFIWFDHQECRDFVKWTNETLNYASRYKEIEELLASYGATIVREETMS